MSFEAERARRLFLSLLGLVFVAAFASLAGQIVGLVGEHGILPASEFLDEVRRYAESSGRGDTAGSGTQDKISRHQRSRRESPSWPKGKVIKFALLSCNGSDEGDHGWFAYHV